jgi:hypothetical protein
LRAPDLNLPPTPIRSRTQREHFGFCISHLYVLDFFLAFGRSRPHLPPTAGQGRLWLMICGANGHGCAVCGSGHPDPS